jgi:arginyl-tRNA synthetase
MILPLHDLVRDRVRAVLAELYGNVAAGVPIPIEYPPNRTLGDLGSPVAFELARRVRQPPRAIAQAIAGALRAPAGVARVDAAANGYLNVFLDRRTFLLERLGLIPGHAAAQPTGVKTIVEHTSINPNKAAHIGHLRNAALGDTLVRVLRFRGTPVEVQNYIDDTGVQVADVVVGFRELQHLDLDAVRHLADTTRFDHYCWDLYARVTQWYEEDQARLSVRAATLHDIEHGGNPAADMGALIADRIVRCHLRTMARLNIDYDLLTWEGDILRLHFWARAFDVLKHTGAVFLQTEGRLAGCWVMAIDDDVNAPPDRAAEDTADAEQREKVIVRSNGTVTYVGKDMANQMWKSGLLGVDFHYRPFADRADRTLIWATTSAADQARSDHPVFGGAAATYNVIDVRQSYLQKLLKQALAAIGHPVEAERLNHFSYEMVALSHATARELGYAPPAGSDEGRRPFVEVSGRKGLGVKADDLIDRVIDKARVEVEQRNPDLPDAERIRTAEVIGVAAVRYFMIKYSRTKVIAFDIAGDGGDDEIWSLVLEAARLDDVVEQVIRSLEFAVLAKYAFGLAQLFNAFYHRAPILSEERIDVRRWRAAAVAYVHQQLTRTLDLMGIAVPSRM